MAHTAAIPPFSESSEAGREGSKPKDLLLPTCIWQPKFLLSYVGYKKLWYCPARFFKNKTTEENPQVKMKKH